MERDAAARARIARGWASSCLTQAEYAQQHGVSERTLRSYLQRYGAGDRPDERARAIVERAIADLKNLRAALDAEAARRDGSGERAGDDGLPERQAAGVVASATTAVTIRAPSAASLRAGLIAGFE